MKHTLNAFLLATAVVSAPAFAATVSDTFDAGDLLVGFYTATGTGATQNLIVNLGAFQQFDNKNGATINFSSSIVSDLVATYGSNWNSRTDLVWSVTGATFASSLDGLTRNTIFATSPRASLGDSPVVIASNTDSALAQVRSQIQSIGGSFNLLDATTNSSVSVVVPGSNPDSMISRMAGASPQFSSANTNDTNGNNYSDLFALVPSVGGLNPSGNSSDYVRGSNLLGTFSLTASGLSFTAVPEPSSYAAIAGVFALGAVAGRRRRQASRA